METSPPADAAGDFERLAADPAEESYILRLYVTGMTPRSLDAIARARTLCEEHLRGRYDLEVIDIYLRPELAAAEQIVAAPTLVRRLPPPLRRLVGDLANTERVLAGLGLRRTGGGA